MSKRLPSVAEMNARLSLLCAGNQANSSPLKSKTDQDPDQDQIKFKIDQDRSRSVTPVKTSNPSNPDGLDHLIKGQFADLLKQDAAYLQARAWGAHPATLTNATKRMGADWVRQQVRFVGGLDKVRAKGAYLSKILAKNPH